MKNIMRMTNYYAPTLKEVPSEAEVISHKLLLKAGMIRKTTSGVYSFLPAGQAVMRKITEIIREEMNNAGAIEVLMPALQPADMWHESGRWDDYGPELMRLHDRHKREFCLGPTHEEVITALVRNELSSYKQLPINMYQIQTKFRDEIRPRFGLLRGREFMMKDAYSFNENQESLQESYEIMAEAYRKIFTRCGLHFTEVEADSGQIGGKITTEYMSLAQSGEAEIAYCDCGYGVDTEVLGYEPNHEDEVKHTCPRCGKPCKTARGIEVGQIFQLGTKYSTSMNCNFMGRDGKEHPFYMGCYGIGVSRTMAAAIEQSNDERGIIWHKNIAPAHVCIIPLFNDEDGKNSTAEQLAFALAEQDIEVIIDDRNDRPGSKFADADLMGWPLQVVIGKRSLESGNVEVKIRKTGDKVDVPLSSAAAKIINLLEY